MRKHSLLLSLLVMFFAVFMTACENTSSKGASISGPDQGGNLPVEIPTLGFTYKHVEGLTYEFTGTLSKGNVEDYTYTWNFGDGSENVVGDSLTVTHTYSNTLAPMVKLSAEPKNPSLGLVSPTPWEETVNFVNSGIQIGRIDYSNGQSGLEFIFQIAAVSNDGSALTYRWNFGDGSEELETSDSIVNHKYGKYNKKYPVTVTVSNGKESVPATLEVSTSALKAVVNVVSDTVNTKNKTFTVDIMDENDNLVHGSSASGSVTGLDNVTYNWNFGDGSSDKTTDRTVSHIYENAESSNYTVTVEVTTDNYEGVITGTAQTNVELGYSLPNFTASLSGNYGLTINASAQGNGGVDYANKTLKYRFKFPDGTHKDIDVLHDENGYVSTPVTVSADLTQYYSEFAVKLVVVDNGKIVADGVAKAAKPTFEYTLTTTAGSSYFNKTFTATPKKGSFLLKDATYTWTFGDGETLTNNYGSANHTFANGGNYTVSVSITSPVIGDSGISVKAVSTDLTLQGTVTINDFICFSNGAQYDFLQYTCSVDASSNGGTLVYKWYVDGVLQEDKTGRLFTVNFDKFNKTYTVKAEVGIQSSNAFEPVTRETQIKTPAVWALMTGPNYLAPGQEGIYTVVPKVTVDGSTKDVQLQDANYTFHVKENGLTENNNGNAAWRKSFTPYNDEYNGNTATRTVYAVVTASNVEGGAITSGETATSINRPQASLADFQSVVVSCNPKSGVNFSKQQCKITVAVRSDSSATGNFNEYKAKITAQGVTKEVLFDYKDLVAGATHDSAIAEFDFNLPNGGDIETGSPQSSSSDVTGYLYKGNNENTRIKATPTTVNINLNMDYVLFPYTTGYEGQGGGTGYSFSTWSCNYNGIYDENVIPRRCGASGNGQTLNLGSLVDGNGNLKGNTKFEWYVRINKADGNNIPETKVHEFYVGAGSKPTDDQIKFNIAGALRNKEYIGSAYNSINNIFYLKITPADDPNAKPIRVWYNGANKTNYGYRLQYITPILRNEHTSCAVRYEYTSHFYTQDYNFLKIHLTSLDYRFDGATKYNSTDFITPSSQAYRPILNFQTDIIGISGWHNRYFNEYNGYGMAATTIDWLWGWRMYIPDWVQLEYKNGAVGNSQVHLQQSSTKLTLSFKDMLNGSGSQVISNHYKPLYCSKTQYVHGGIN